MKPPPNPESSWLVRIGGKLRAPLDRVIARYSLVGNPPVFDDGTFPWMRELEREWPVIRRELETVLRHRDAIPTLDSISPDHKRIAPKGMWRSFFLWGYGYRVDENCARCPRTARIIQHIPGLNSAFFSILAPGIHIPPHEGVTKGLLTCHLGLIVPARAEDCRMRVGPDMVRWAEGKAFAFDDTYTHEVWNDTNETRVILLVQFERPLRGLGKRLANLFLGAVKRTEFVQEARRNLGSWEEAFRRAEAARQARSNLTHHPERETEQAA